MNKYIDTYITFFKNINVDNDLQLLTIMITSVAPPPSSMFHCLCIWSPNHQQWEGHLPNLLLPHK